MHPEDQLIALSALQHWLYCPRQCALIHVEQAWAERQFVGSTAAAVHDCLKAGVDPAQLVTLRARLLEIVDLKTDSVRFYHLGANWHHKVEHHGANDGYDVDGTLVV